MHLIKYDPKNLIFNAWVASINDTFIQVCINTNERRLCFFDSSTFYAELVEDKNLSICIDPFKNKIIHVFQCFEYTDENEGSIYSTKEENRGWIFLIADFEDEHPKEFAKRYFMFGSQFDNKDQMIWSLAPADILLKHKTISDV